MNEVDDQKVKGNEKEVDAETIQMINEQFYQSTENKDSTGAENLHKSDSTEIIIQTTSQNAIQAKPNYIESMRNKIFKIASEIIASYAEDNWVDKIVPEEVRAGISKTLDESHILENTAEKLREYNWTKGHSKKYKIIFDCKAIKPLEKFEILYILLISEKEEEKALQEKILEKLSVEAIEVSGKEKLQTFFKNCIKHYVLTEYENVSKFNDAFLVLTSSIIPVFNQYIDSIIECVARKKLFESKNPVESHQWIDALRKFNSGQPWVENSLLKNHSNNIKEYYGEEMSLNSYSGSSGSGEIFSSDDTSTEKLEEKSKKRSVPKPIPLSKSRLQELLQDTWGEESVKVLRVTSDIFLEHFCDSKLKPTLNLLYSAYDLCLLTIKGNLPSHDDLKNDTPPVLIKLCGDDNEISYYLYSMTTKRKEYVLLDKESVELCQLNAEFEKDSSFPISVSNDDKYGDLFNIIHQSHKKFVFCITFKPNGNMKLDTAFIAAKNIQWYMKLHNPSYPHIGIHFNYEDPNNALIYVPEEREESLIEAIQHAKRMEHYIRTAINGIKCFQGQCVRVYAYENFLYKLEPFEKIFILAAFFKDDKISAELQSDVATSMGLTGIKSGVKSNITAAKNKINEIIYADLKCLYGVDKLKLLQEYVNKVINKLIVFLNRRNNIQSGPPEWRMMLQALIAGKAELNSETTINNSSAMQFTNYVPNVLNGISKYLNEMSSSPFSGFSNFFSRDHIKRANNFKILLEWDESVMTLQVKHVIIYLLFAGNAVDVELKKNVSHEMEYEDDFEKASARICLMWAQGLFEAYGSQYSEEELLKIIKRQAGSSEEKALYSNLCSVMSQIIVFIDEPDRFNSEDAKNSEWLKNLNNLYSGEYFDKDEEDDESKKSQNFDAF